MTTILAIKLAPFDISFAHMLHTLILKEQIHTAFNIL